MNMLKSHRNALLLALYERDKTAGERECLPEFIAVKTLQLLLSDGEFESAIAFAERFQVLLNYLPHLSTDSPLIDFEGLRDRFPNLARFLRLQRDRARVRSFTSPDGILVETVQERAVRLLESRLAEIRAEVRARAIS